MINEMDVFTITFVHIKGDEIEQKIYAHELFQGMDMETQIETIERIKDQFDLLITEIKVNGPIISTDVGDQIIH